MKLNLYRLSHILGSIGKLTLIAVGVTAVCFCGWLVFADFFKCFSYPGTEMLSAAAREMLLHMLLYIQIFTFGLAFALSFLMHDRKGRMKRTFCSVEQLEQERASIDDVIRVAKENRKGKK